VHGRGIGTEAVKAVINDGFERHGYDEIVARAESENVDRDLALARISS
jgi:RimJ/RimL family protein N-acetyltransferase